MEDYKTENGRYSGSGYSDAGNAGAEGFPRQGPSCACYQHGGTSAGNGERKKTRGAAGYVLTGVLCLLIGLAMGSCGAALAISGVRGAIKEAAPDRDGEEGFGGFEFRFGPGDFKYKKYDGEKYEEYVEPEKREYIARELPEFDGRAPVIADAANPAPDVVQQVFDGVVGINSYIRTEGRRVQKGYGSGFVAASEGYVITNAHVIRDAEEVTVTFSDSEEADAEIVGYDNTMDVAVLKVEKAGLTALSLGNSGGVRVGEFIIVMGNPSGAELAGTATFGIISATARTINIEGQTNTYLQTDAAVNLGNSGGPMLNMKGEVVGITSAKNVYAGYDEFGNAVNAEGLGFAIPINEAMDVVCQLISQGRVVRPGMGVSVMEINADAAEQYDVHEGILVFSVTKNGPAHKAGVKTDDIIIEYDGIDAATQEEFVKYVKSLKVGDALKLKVLRNGETLELEVTLRDMNELGSKLVGGESKLFD